jgi:electron transfer flavoprotein alpha subunit
MSNEFEKTNMTFEEAQQIYTEAQNALAVQNGTVSTFAMDDNEDFIADLTTRQQTFCSLIPKTEEEQDILFTAMNCPENRIKDCINMEIEIKDIYAEVVQCTNEKTGKKESAPRIVLIDTEGQAYQAVSVGMYSALKKVFTSFGTPDTWKAPKKFRVRQISKSADRSILTLDAVLPAKKK